MSEGERRKKERRRKQSLDSPQTIEANKNHPTVVDNLHKYLAYEYMNIFHN